MEKRNNIVIIGCGNLGRRHLQAAVQAKISLNVFVYDINTEVFQLAEEILKKTDIHTGTEVHYITSFDEMPETIFLTVIASSSNGRATIIEKLLTKSKVSYMILEKVLFQSYDDYDKIEKLINDENVKTYVNCPRRYYPIYQKLKKEIDKKKFKFYVSGTDWGLGCNFIHYLDLIAFLGGNSNISLNLANLDDEIKDSKRNGYKEITGTIDGSVGNCTSFSITSYATQMEDLSLYIETESDRITVFEPQKLCYIIGKSTQWKMKKISFEILFQSNLTNLYIEELANTGNCELTPYHESSILHKAFIKPLTEYFRERGEKNNLCPIT